MKTTILLVDDNATDRLIFRSILQTDVDFISKPVTPSALLHKVREVPDR